MYLLLVLLPFFAAQVFAGCSFANQEGLNNPHGDLRKRDASSSYVPLKERDDNRVLIGDLRYNISTPTGQTIANIILGTETGQSQAYSTRPATPKACKADKCCVWYNISSDITNEFQANAGCGDIARQTIRAAFHDAATWSAPREAKGQNCCGADGSLILSGTEINRTDNLGLEDMPGFFNPLYQKYHSHGVSMADLIQYAGIHATVTCTNGPRVRAFVGRKDSKKAAPTGLIPEPYQSAEYLVDLFSNKTIIPDDFIALVGAHTTGKQFFVNTSLAGEPFDPSPGVWDVFFYSSVLQNPPPSGVFRLQSDAALSTSSLTSGRWNQLASGSQGQWNEAYSTAYVRLSLLGVNNINNLTECTQTLPMAIQD